jgi:hypothetical protein
MFGDHMLMPATTNTDTYHGQESCGMRDAGYGIGMGCRALHTEKRFVSWIIIPNLASRISHLVTRFPQHPENGQVDIEVQP